MSPTDVFLLVSMLAVCNHEHTTWSSSSEGFPHLLSLSPPFPAYPVSHRLPDTKLCGFKEADPSCVLRDDTSVVDVRSSALWIGLQLRHTESNQTNSCSDLLQTGIVVFITEMKDGCKTVQSSR